MVVRRFPVQALALAALVGAAACTVEGTGGGRDTVDAAAQAGSDAGGQPVDAAAPGADASPPAVDGSATNECPRARVTTSGSDLRIREEPNTSSEILGGLANGSVVPVLDRVQGEAVSGDTEWFEIDDSGTIGFISGAFADCTTDAALSPPPSPTESAPVG